MINNNPHIIVEDLTMTYGSFIIQKDLNFTIPRGNIFIIMGGSGCGKSTLMRHLVGLNEPSKGRILFNAEDLWNCTLAKQQQMMRSMGVLFQSGALWSSMTLAQNVSIPLEEYTTLTKEDMKEIVHLKLSLVGLAGFEDFYPAEISGGMRKRAALARAIALDPEILFFDEPSAGLDPISSRRLDDLILELRDSTNTTIVIVTHELASIFAIGDDAIFLDPETKTMIESGNPRQMLKSSEIQKVREFLNRGEL